MRLLHFSHAGKLVSTNFSGKTIPPYAILSHRWGNDEVLFHDLETDSYKKKEGYRKIEFCAEQAARDQLQYFWIDTCCIDKWNLDELSRSINSMFLWYKNSTKCYVFLPDVSIHSATLAQQSSWEISFRTSVWFTRGWTLQELIAPVDVGFFSAEGQLMGDKQSLEKLIHEITRIPGKALQNCPLDEFTVSERMQWAETRVTTEPEDKVYCLLGIVDIFMPTFYGEGKEKAWERLQAELDAANSTPYIIPFSRNDHFVGREPQLAKLEEELFGKTRVMAIVGAGGTGKSQLGLELAYRTRQHKKSCSVFWIDASNIDSLDQAYTSIAQKLKIPGWSDEKADTKQLVSLYLSRSDANQSLLIFDNAESIKLQSIGFNKARAANLIDYLPESERCSILITTTSRDTATRLASQKIIELDEMTSDTAGRMLQNYLRTSATEQSEAKLLLQELSNLPLALVQAAAYMNNRGITIQEYRSQLAEHKESALKHSSEFSERKRHDNDTEDPVATTLLLSVDQISKDTPLAADYLFLAACLNPKDMSLELLETSSYRAKEDAIRTLHSYALITRRPAESALDIHRLVHRALQEWLRDQDRLEQWTQTAIARLVSVFPDHNHGGRSKWRRLLPHAMYALSRSPSYHEEMDRMSLAWECAIALSSDGRHSESEELFVQVMESRKKVFGDEHPDTLTSMSYLASTYRDQGQWKEAEGLEVQVIQTRRKVLGHEHLETLTSMGNLALTLGKQGRWREAEELEVQVMEATKRALGNEHRSTLTCMANLALTFWNQGRWKEAEELEVQVVETRRKVLGDENPSTLTSISNLASTYRSQGQWRKAEELLIQAIEIRKRVLGDEHPSTLTSMGNLASTYRSQGRWQEAEGLEAQIVVIRKRVLGEDHPSTLTSMGNLALTFGSQGRWKEAEKLEVQVMDIRKKVLGDENPSTLICMGNLASTYMKQGRWKEAEKLEMQVMGTRRKVLGDEHPATLASIANLALTFGNQGRWKEAKELFVQVIETNKRVLGDEHPETLTSIGNLALTYINQGWWKEAEELETQVMEIRRRVLGDEHPETLTSMGNLALAYGNQGRWKEAEELEVQVLETRRKVLGNEHPETLTSMGNLAFMLKSQGFISRAISLMEDYYKLGVVVFGSQHPMLSSSQEILIQWRLELLELNK